MADYRPENIKRIFLLPNLMTAGNLIFGFLAVLKIFEGSIQRETGEENWGHTYMTSLYCILAACLFDLLRESNTAVDRGELTPGQAAQLLVDWRRMDSVLGFEREAAAIPADVLALVEEREKARVAKEWKKSDELRDAILAKGWVVKDTKEGSKLTPR